MWRPSFILVAKFHSKICIVSTLYELCDWIPVRNNGVFTIDVAEYVGLITASLLLEDRIFYSTSFICKIKIPVN